MEITGIVDRIIYRNADNGYTVLTLRTDTPDKEVTLCGTLPLASPGEQLRVQGAMKYHPKYGQQFSVSFAETLAPSTQIAIENYLAGGTVKLDANGAGMISAPIPATVESGTYSLRLLVPGTSTVVAERSV